MLRFLIYLVLHKEKMSPEEYNKQGHANNETTAEKTKKSLLELLKNDESLRQSVFGQLKAQENLSDNTMGTSNMNRISEQDRANLQ